MKQVFIHSIVVSVLALLTTVILSSFSHGILCGKSGVAESKYLQPKPEFSWVTMQAGTFMMGSPADETGRLDDELQHQVTLKSYKISKYEVTFDQYDAFCNATDREKPDDKGWGRGKRPVINVTWEDAVAFAKWMDCRLPTEAEWEYACRATTTTAFNSGDCLGAKQGNFNGGQEYGKCPKSVVSSKTMEVGSYAPNNRGIYDMHGNVWEWCSDWYGPYEKFSQKNPKGPEFGEYKVYRGGSWSTVAQICRSACRGNMSPKNAGDDVGFRIVTTDFDRMN